MTEENVIAYAKNPTESRISPLPEDELMFGRGQTPPHNKTISNSLSDNVSQR